MDPMETQDAKMLCQEASQQGDQATQGQDLGFSNRLEMADFISQSPKITSSK